MPAGDLLRQWCVCVGWGVMVVRCACATLRVTWGSESNLWLWCACAVPPLLYLTNLWHGIVTDTHVSQIHIWSLSKHPKLTEAGERPAGNCLHILQQCSNAAVCLCHMTFVGRLPTTSLVGLTDIITLVPRPFIFRRSAGGLVLFVVLFFSAPPWASPFPF